jgi:2-polyprenyl-3-methyl-5-hydroxy-6-metoxy-1,4-benzoquinol methylase
MNPFSNNDNVTDFDDITDAGERVTHLYPNDCYYAHLSIYKFAVKYAQDKLVLDAGSGAGYGTAYIADKGAHFVWGIDVNSKAIAFSKYHFQRQNLKFMVMNLQRIHGFPSRHFDLIFSSNVLEHIPNVPLFLRHAWQSLKPEGVMIIAVPPIINEESRKMNLENRYHLNIWSPLQWNYVLKQFFSEVECYRHHFEKLGIELDFANKPDQTLITEEDFLLLPVSVEYFCKIGGITAIFVMRKPLPKHALPDGNNISFIDNSFTRTPDGNNISFIDNSFTRTPDGNNISFIDNSFTNVPTINIWQLIQIGWNFYRQNGIIAFTKKTCLFFLKKLRGKSVVSG